ANTYPLSLHDALPILERRVEQAVRAHFRPEFINRIDEIVTFHPLSKEDLRRIVDLHTKGLEALLAERQIRIHLTDAARDALAERSEEHTSELQSLTNL